ncbi:MAG: bacterial Ig-like domain-containing protein [Oscillospiraceae bacterium]|nr:bacterial Ig-like domain-containing protein [Oscillospiraceae bacterium]
MKTTQKTAALFLVLMMIAGLLPAQVLAAAGDDIGRTIDVGSSGRSDGDTGTGWSYSDNVFTVTGDVTLKGKTNNGIVKRVVISGGTADKPLQVTLQSLTIAALQAGAPIELKTGTHAVLTLDGSSWLSTYDENENNPGIRTTGAYLTIEAGKDTGELEVTGGDNAAGIGGGAGGHGGTVTINGGIVTADSVYGAGIGGGAGGDGGVVTVNGGIVTATSKQGAGIGGGRGSAGSSGYNGGDAAFIKFGRTGGSGQTGGGGGGGAAVTINGGAVTAGSEYGAGIGGGRGGDGGSGGSGGDAWVIWARGYKGGSGGQGGRGGAGATVRLNGGAVKAASANAAGIGGGSGGGGGRGGGGGSGGKWGKNGSSGSAGAAGAQGGVGSCEVNRVHNHTWWAAKGANQDPGGPGTTYPDDAFTNDNAYRYVKIQVRTAVLWDDIRAGNTRQDAVKTDLNLFTSDEKGAVIEWTSSEPEAISPDGRVTRPAYPEDDKKVQLTAKIQLGSFSDEITFDINVPTLSWDDRADADWYTETEQTLYIKNAGQLASLARIVSGKDGLCDEFAGKTVILTADIDLSELPWVPIGTQDHPFKGRFLGEAHTISGLKFVNNAAGRQGLFGWNCGSISDTGVVELQIEGGWESGGIAAVNGDEQFGGEAAIENCVVSGSVAADSAGGLVGSNYGKILNGYFYGALTGAGSGGIAGVNRGDGIESAYYSYGAEGPESAVGAETKGVLTCVGRFDDTGAIVGSDGTETEYGEELLRALNTCAEWHGLRFDWEKNRGSGVPPVVFSGEVREDRVAAAAASHTIVVKHDSGQFVENAKVRIGEGVYTTDRFGMVTVWDETLFGVNRVYVTPTPEKSCRRGEAYYALTPGKSRTLFLEAWQDDGKPYVTMAADTETFADVRAASVFFMQYKGDMLRLLCAGEWAGGGGGRFMLYQSGGKYIYSDADGVISLAPGLTFSPEEPLWLRMEPDDESKPTSDFVPVYVRVIRSDSDFEKTMKSVDRSPNFTATPKESGLVDGEATRVYPENVKLPMTAMATLSSAAQALDGTITFHGYVGDFKDGPKFGFSVGGLSDAFELLKDAKDQMKTEDEYERLKDEWSKVLEKKADEGKEISRKELDEMLADIDVPQSARARVADIVEKRVTECIEKELARPEVAGLVESFDELFDVLDGHMAALCKKMDTALDFAFDKLVNVLQLENLAAAERAWKAFKSDFQAAKNNVGARGCLDTLKDKYGITEKTFTVVPGLVAGGIGGIGYFEVTFDMYGRQLSSTGEVMVSGYAEGKKTFTFVLGFIPVSVEIGGGLGLGAAVKTVVGASGGGVMFNGEVVVGINPYMWLSAGVGVRNLAYCGVRGDAGLYIEVFASNNNKPSTSGRLTASAGIEAELLFFIKKSWTLGRYEKQLWGRARTARAAFGAFAFEDEEAYYAYEDGGFALSSREYLSHTTPWNGRWRADGAAALRRSAAADIPLQDGVLPGSVPQFAKAGDQTVMLFQADDGVSPTGNHIRLMYTVLQDDGWSEPEPVWDNGTSDFFAKTLTVGDDLYVLWQKSKAVLAEEEDPQALLDQTLPNMELCFAKWDADALQFAEPAYITDNDAAEMTPTLVAGEGGLTALWTEVREGDLFGGGEGLYAAVGSVLSDGAWSEPKTLFETSTYINELAAGYAGGELTIAYGTFGDEDTPAIWIWHGAISAPISHAQGASGLRFYDGRFFWQEAGSIYSYDAAANEALPPVTAGGGLISGSYRVMEGAGKKAIVWAEPNVDTDPEAERYVIRASFAQADGYGPPVTLKTVGGELAHFDAALTEEGGWQFVLNTYQAAEGGEEEPEHALWYAEVEPKTDIALDYVYASAADVAHGVQPIDLVVRNLGETAVEQLYVTLTGHEALTKPLTLAPGQTATVSETVDLHKLPADGRLRAEVSCEGDSDSDNNVYETTVGLTDVAVSVTQQRVGDRIFLTAALSNDADIATETTLTVRENDANGRLLSEKRLVADSRKTIEVFFDVDVLRTAADKLYFEAETAKPDAYPDNNRVTAPLYRERPTPPAADLTMDPAQEIRWVPAEGVSLSGESLFYRQEENETPEEAKFTARVYPEDASNRDVVWLSSDARVAHVDDSGQLTLRAPGQTVITVVTKDGAHRDSLEVTVKDARHTLTVGETVGGYVTVDGARAGEAESVEREGGDQVSIEAAPFAGYRFVRWVSVPSDCLDDEMSNPAVLTMPDEDATVQPLFKLSGKNRVLWSLSLNPPPRTEYYEGEQLDISGISVLGNFDEGDGFGLSGYAVDPEPGTPLTRDMESVTVSYTEGGVTKTARFEITVKEPQLQSIAVTAPDTTFYVEGSRLDPEGLVVTAHYTNGSRPIDDYTMDLGLDDPLTLDRNKVTVSHSEGSVTVTDSFDVTVVKEIHINGVEVGSKQTTVYFGIHSAAGKGYAVHLAEMPEELAGGQPEDWRFAPYTNVSYQKTGLVIKGLTKSKNYLMYITYTENGAVAEQSFPVLIPSNPLSITDEDGYLIVTTASELDAIRSNPAGKYRLYADIDLTDYISSNCTAEKGWYPIGYGAPYFSGELDGQGHTISGLWSGKGWGISYKGLFSVTMGAVIKNVHIELDERGITGGYEVGGVTGDARNGTVIENCTVSGGQIVVTGGGYAGGLVGRAYGSPPVVFKDCTVAGTYTKTSGNYSGGLVGCALGKTQIIRCQTIDTVSEGGSYVGGLAGALHGGASIEAAYASGTVKAAASYAGGLAGAVYEASSISGGYAVVDVSASHYAGGLVGTLYGRSTLFKSCAYGDVTTKNYIAGGLVGEAIAAVISNCYAQGDVKGTTGVGGLVGYFSGSGTGGDKSVENCYSSGKVSGTGTTEYGAFNGRSGVKYLGTNHYDGDKAGVSRGQGTSGSPAGAPSAYPQSQTTANMMKRSTFAGWDFENIWHIREGEYPFFERIASDEPQP